MDLDPKDREKLTELAKTILDSLARVAKRARGELGTLPGEVHAENVLINSPGRFDGSQQEVQRRLGLNRQQRTNDLARLEKEPFIARVVAQDEKGKSQTLYITRATPPAGLNELDGRVASYRTPLGRLAEFAPGESVTVKVAAKGRPEPKEIEYRLKQLVRLTPELVPEGWDGINSQYRESARNLIIGSLRALVGETGADQALLDVLAGLEAEAASIAAIRDRARRQIVSRMSLRDQPILDRAQGDVFRLSLDRRVALFGPPGTGKTTTLIQRIAQKRNWDELSDDEKESFPREEFALFFHPNNWVMFSPTELLRLYLKEAFSSNGVAATDERVRTWTDKRRHLGRDVFRLLRSEKGGRFTLNEDRQLLSDNSGEAARALFEDFEAFFSASIVDQYERHLKTLDESGDPELSRLAQQARGRRGLSFDRLFALLEIVPSAQEASTKVNGRVTSEFQVLVKGKGIGTPAFIQDLVTFLATLGAEGSEDEDEDEPDEEEDRRPGPSDPRYAAARALRAAFYAKARSVVNSTSLSKSSRPRAIWEWLGTRAPLDDAMRPLGAALQTQRAVNFLKGTHLNLVSQGAVRAFQRFRRARLKEKLHYRREAGDAFDRASISAAELDVVLLLMLRNARRLIAAARRSRIDLTRYAILESVRGEFHTQVVVDEATDFSPVQLACMLALAEPSFRSLFVCGDVRQRITPWGVRDLSQLKWVSDDFEVHEIEVGYRQSPRLAELARKIAVAGGGPEPMVRAPLDVETADVKPWLGEKLAGEALHAWLAERIRRIAMDLGTVPSIAVFVDGEERVEGLARDLQATLVDMNLRVVPCRGGEIGQDDQIRVFDIQHIKGLEFEAAFFIDIDSLSQRYPDLFDKFLYVGVTRAATYLGVTCAKKLPRVLEFARTDFSTE